MTKKLWDELMFESRTIVASKVGSAGLLVILSTSPMMRFSGIRVVGRVKTVVFELKAVLESRLMMWASFFL